MTTTTVPFSARIREATVAAHDDAEGSGFLSGLTEGTRPITDYARLVAQHLAIYRAIESANAAMRADPIAGAFVFPELDRVARLEADLHAILGEDWAARPEATPLPATVDYAERIREVGATWPGGWVAHHYVRYLGDLSGGIFIRRRLEDAYGIDATSGTAFYDFPEIPDAMAWKNVYRSRLDDAPWDEAEQADVVAEILQAYDWNNRLLGELNG